MSDLYKALADATRRSLLLRVAQTPSSVNDLAEGFSMSRPAISRHLKQLEEAGLVSFRPGTDARQRICYAELQALSELDDYLSKVRSFWNKRLDGLADFLDKDSGLTAQE